MRSDLDPVPDASPAVQEAERVEAPSSALVRIEAVAAAHAFVDACREAEAGGWNEPASAVELWSAMPPSQRHPYLRPALAAIQALAALASHEPPAPGGRVAPDAVRTAAEAALKALDDLMGESEGVYGLHRNGDPAPWSTLTEDGEFEEWLLPFEELRAALDHAQPIAPAGLALDAQPPAPDGGSTITEDDPNAAYERGVFDGSANVRPSPAGAVAEIDLPLIVRDTVAQFEKIHQDWGMNLTRLVDGVSTYEARAAGERREFDNTDDLYEWIGEIKRNGKERVLLAALEAIYTRAERAEELASKYKWQVRDTCVRAEKAESAIAARDAEIARLKAAVRDGEVPAELEALSDAATPGPWKWWTSNSWLRLGTDARGKDRNGVPYGQDGYVAYPYISRGDRHPDLCIRNEADRDLITHAVNNLRSRIAARRGASRDDGEGVK